MSSAITGVEVLDRDVAREAYRVCAARIVAFVPECLMDSPRPGMRPSQQEAYEWIAAHGPRLRAAMTAPDRGQSPKPPYNLLDIEGERQDAH